MVRYMPDDEWMNGSWLDFLEEDEEEYLERELDAYLADIDALLRDFDEPFYNDFEKECMLDSMLPEHLPETLLTDEEETHL